jgi:RimJ/RimL family protein N-acetyltransferase
VAAGGWFPESIAGDLVVLRRHGPGNLPAFRRWYGDREVARLARYQDAPMRLDEIDRFFQARALGPDSLAMAIHVRRTDRLIGSCAFSQLDGDNGSALYHITIGEKDAWGHGYGTEATALMIEHAFRVLGLHRVGLAVFEFNERAIRAYRRCGFVVEGRAREAIWRDGRWWDEIQMSILAAEWRRRPTRLDGSVRAGRPARARLVVEGRPAADGARTLGDPAVVEAADLETPLP